MSPPTNNKHTAQNLQIGFRRNYRGIARLPLFIVVLLFCGSIVLALLNMQNIRDAWLLKGYDAPTAIADIATQDTMTDYGRKIFYVNHPTVYQKSGFTEACPDSSTEKTIVLGCYHSDQAGIFLLDVTDPRLNGVKQVTSAHEMLHAAYDRLNSIERKKVNKMLLDYYHNDLQDQRIKTTIDAYKKSEPKDVVNEMHSIFGTEVANLPTGLENYYQKYFTNRKQVAAFSAQYQAEFTSRQDQVKAADAQLSQLRAQIESQEADLKTQQATISSKQAELTALRDGGNTAAYNAGVPGYNNLVNSYNAQVQSIKQLVNQYNHLVASRNATALEEDQLINNLSANAQTINN